VPTKKGNQLHSKGNMLPFLAGASPTQSAYAGALAFVLRAEVDQPGSGAKTIMRWTGASERAVKGWLGGRRGPSAEHLIALIAQSDAVLAVVMQLAGRHQTAPRGQIAEARQLIRDALALLDTVAS
jgi:hypothetical protein